MSNDQMTALQSAYNRECAIIGEAYSIITDQKAVLKAATARRSQIIAQLGQLQKAAQEVSNGNVGE